MERKVLATVGEKEITNYDVESALTSLDPYQAMHFGTEEGKKQLLEQMISFELMFQFGKEASLDKTKEFETEVEKFKKELRQHRCSEGCQLFSGAGAGADHHRLLRQRQDHPASLSEFSGEPR